MNPEHRPIRVAVGRSADDATPPPLEPETTTVHRVAQTPLIDIHEGPEGLILEADLPGATEDVVSIQLADNVLSIAARVGSTVLKGAKPLIEEYHVGEFGRSFILSDEVDRGRITAELNNGVLRLALPKAEVVKTRRIEIKSK